LSGSELSSEFREALNVANGDEWEEGEAETEFAVVSLFRNLGSTSTISEPLCICITTRRIDSQLGRRESRRWKSIYNGGKYNFEKSSFKQSGRGMHTKTNLYNDDTDEHV